MSEQAPVAGQQSEPITDAERTPVATGEPAQDSAPAEPAVRPRRDAWFFVIAAAVIALDQLTKFLVRAGLDRGEAWPDRDWLLNIVNVSNSGAAFGILQGQTVFLIGMSIVGAAAIILFYFYPPLEHGLLRVALGLQLGGAAGNLIDRVRTGEVTDFINFDFWPAFNVADASISIGVVTIIWFFLSVEAAQRRKPADGG
ncbi:MAG: signal peptidase II [Chloroflexi bacterium]|nr:signal peptidase II [Chloroflexota bacterium]